MLILIVFSLVSGLVTVLSPCILPVLPIVLSSSVGKGKARPIGVITGLIISFSIFTLAISKIVSLLGLSANTLRIVAVVVIGILGLSLVIPSLNALFERATSFLPRLANSRSKRKNGFGAGFITGAGLGLIWAPCAGPILAAVTTLAATQAVSFGVVLVVVAYAVGAGIPLLGIAYGGRSLIKRVPFLTRNLQWVQKGFGILMVLTAVLIAFNVDTLVTVWATNLLPASWSSTLTSFEKNPAVSKQLGQLRPGSGDTSAGSNQAQAGGSDTGSSAAMVDLPDMGPAPDFAGITDWINSEPLTLQDLRGKVVLVDFWTYSCINCIRTFPYLNDWYSKYQADGFVIVGVHSPEFAFEHDLSNVQAAVKRYNIEYPVALDNNFDTWNAYNNIYWPAEYLIDAQGHIRHTHFGEGKYDETEMVIQQLLAEAGHSVDNSLTQQSRSPFASGQTPETYIGTGRQDHFASPEMVEPGMPSMYTIPDSIPLHYFAVSGTWNFQKQYAEATQAGDMLALHFFAKDVYLVMVSDQPVPVKVKLIMPDVSNQSEDINADGFLTVSASRLYHLVGLDQAQEGSLTLQFDQPGVQIYAFTFGG